MSPEGRFHGLVLGLTVGAMAALAPFMVAGLQHASERITGVPILAALLGAVIAFLTSTGAYKFLSWALKTVLGKFQWLKAQLLGPAFLEGTWVGYFFGKAGDLRFFVEVFEQDLSTLRIRGESYTDDAKPHASWYSQAVMLDASTARLVYTSTIKILTQNVVHESLVDLKLERTDSNATAEYLRGDTADIANGIRVALHIKKASNKGIPLATALELAREYYNDDLRSRIRAPVTPQSHLLPSTTASRNIPPPRHVTDATAVPASGQAED